MNENDESTLASRLGKTVHVSPLRIKLRRLSREYPCSACRCVEDWLVVAANSRGAKVVVPPFDVPQSFDCPGEDVLSNEELVAGICQLQCRDRPQMLRLAAQLISRGCVDMAVLKRLAVMERVEPVLAELSRQALKADPDHVQWLEIRDAFGDQPPLREPILHWTRLAEPIMRNGRCNAESWRLIA